ncbi:MAG: hypothetical protein ABI445_24235 [Polyangia bacterium]
MRAALLALALLAACGGSSRTNDPADLSNAGTASADLGFGGMDAANPLTLDLAVAGDAASASPTDMATCGHAGTGCCDSAQYDAAFCSDSRQGSPCNVGSCGAEETCLRQDTVVAYGAPTCYACGHLGEKCCGMSDVMGTDPSTIGGTCPHGGQCLTAGAPTYNYRCQ